MKNKTQTNNRLNKNRSERRSEKRRRTSQENFKTLPLTSNTIMVEKNLRTLKVKSRQKAGQTRKNFADKTTKTRIPVDVNG